MKKILVLFAVLLVAFMVFACGQTATTPKPAATTDGTTTAATTTAKPTDAPTSATTVVTTEATTTTEVTTTTGTTAPITAGDVYVDLDFSDEDGITDKMNNVSIKEVGTAGTNLLRVTHNGKTKVRDVLSIKANSWLECTFTNLADAAQLNKLVEEVKGWTVEAFYLNKENTNVQGIVCATEGNVKEYGKQGWGLADNAGNPYFIFGDGTNNWSTTGKAGLSSKTELCHVVAVYDATAKTNSVYLNGKLIKSVEAKGFVAAQALGKDSTGEKVFNIGNGFFIGADPTVGSAACDYDAKDLTVVDVKIYAGALSAEKVAEVYAAAAADYATETVEEAFVGAGYDLDDFNKLEITPTLHRYWNSTSADLHSVLNGADEDATSIKFFATQKFTKEQIPFGSVIVALDGYKYRADGWQEDNAKSSTRGGECTAKITIVNRAWWSDYTVRGFNVANADGSSKITADEYTVFAIFVPKTPVNEVTPTENNFVVFVPAGNTTSAINVTTGETFADVEVINYVEIKGGHFYVANKDGDTVKIFREVGAAVSTQLVTTGGTNTFVNESGVTKVKGYSGYLMKTQGNKNYTLNAYMNTSLMSLNLDGLNLGKFGKITITEIESDAITVKDETGKSFYITDEKVNFVYVDYEGKKLVKATGNAYTPLGMNHMEMIRYAQDIALGKEYGYTRAAWREALRCYGGYTSVVTHNGKYDGTTQQNSTLNDWTNALVPVKFASVLSNYQKYVTVKDESTIQADINAAKAALDAAQAAYDAAIEANADLKALKADMDAKYVVYEATLQPHYEARAAYETSKSLKGAEHAETLALKPAFDEAAKVMNDAKAPYDEAKAAYDAKLAEVLAADEAFKALSDTLAEATTAHTNANKAQQAVEDYKVWKPLYDKFMAEYEKVANVALWTEDDVDNETLDTTSVIGKMFKDIAEENRSLPSFTYFYDEAADTYTIFITSATQPNAPKTWTNNTACGSFNDLKKYGN